MKILLLKSHRVGLRTLIPTGLAAHVVLDLPSVQRLDQARLRRVLELRLERIVEDFRHLLHILLLESLQVGPAEAFR